MKILAIERENEGFSAEDFAPYLHDEARQAWQLYLDGVIREMYFVRDRHIAILILECQDEKEAQQKLATLPLVQAGLIRFEVMPLVPYDGFARLFAHD